MDIGKIRRVQSIREHIESLIYEGSKKKKRINVYYKLTYYGTYSSVRDVALAVAKHENVIRATMKRDGCTADGFYFKEA